MKTEISVIIPVYNVQDFLKDCIDSVIAQTFKNYEIILVDDGSTDDSGKICDQYNIYKNVQVHHTSNQGLSEARNTGLNFAMGKYVCFIDSDDFVTVNYLQTLYDLIQDDSMISIVPSKLVPQNVNFNMQNVDIDIKNSQKINSEVALEKMLSRDDFGVAAWGKLFDKRLFNDVKWPKNKIFEDLITVPKIFDKANNVKFLRGGEPLYYWRSRKDSITRGKVDGKIKPLLSSLNELKNSMRNRSTSLNNAVQARYIEEVINILINKLIFENNFIQEWKIILENDREIWKGILKNNKINWLKKARALLLVNFPQVYQKLTIKHLLDKE